MYSALIQPNISIDKVNNDKLWKLKLPLRIKVFGWYLRKGVILTKDNLAKRIGMAVRNVYFVIKMRQYNIYSSSANLQDLYGQSSN
jgi:hypothetical protein